MTILHLLAQATTSAPTSRTVDPPWYVKNQMVVIMVMVAAIYIFMFRSKKKQDAKKKEKLETLKRGDEIQTIGGIIGTVVEARDNEVIVKVDETNNTKMRFSRNAIHRVLEPKTKDTK